MALELVTNAVASIGSLITGVMNYVTDMFLTPPLKATLKHLEETELQTLQGGSSQLCFYPPKKKKNPIKIIFISALNGAAVLKGPFVHMDLICCSTLLIFCFISSLREKNPESKISV